MLVSKQWKKNEKTVKTNEMKEEKNEKQKTQLNQIVHEIIKVSGGKEKMEWILKVIFVWNRFNLLIHGKWRLGFCVYGSVIETVRAFF